MEQYRTCQLDSGQHKGACRRYRCKSQRTVHCVSIDTQSSLLSGTPMCDTDYMVATSRSWSVVIDEPPCATTSGRLSVAPIVKLAPH